MNSISQDRSDSYAITIRNVSPHPSEKNTNLSNQDRSTRHVAFSVISQERDIQRPRKKPTINVDVDRFNLVFYQIYEKDLSRALGLIEKIPFGSLTPLQKIHSCVQLLHMHFKVKDLSINLSEQMVFLRAIFPYLEKMLASGDMHEFIPKEHMLLSQIFTAINQQHFLVAADLINKISIEETTSGHLTQIQSKIESLSKGSSRSLLLTRIIDKRHQFYREQVKTKFFEFLSLLGKDIEPVKRISLAIQENRLRDATMLIGSYTRISTFELTWLYLEAKSSSPGIERDSLLQSINKKVSLGWLSERRSFQQRV